MLRYDRFLENGLLNSFCMFPCTPGTSLKIQNWVVGQENGGESQPSSPRTNIGGQIYSTAFSSITYYGMT